MPTERMVVTLLTPKVLTNSITGMHAARILELGLTAYGETKVEALHRVKRMYVADVRLHRELGTLEEWLNRSGLNWFWRDEYKGALPVEEADAPMVSEYWSNHTSLNTWIPEEKTAILVRKAA